MKYIIVTFIERLLLDLAYRQSKWTHNYVKEFLNMVGVLWIAHVDVFIWKVLLILVSVAFNGLHAVICLHVHNHTISVLPTQFVFVILDAVILLFVFLQQWSSQVFVRQLKVRKQKYFDFTTLLGTTFKFL